ncbi:MAG TPA: hypothetical protein VLM88_00515 [Proteiniclasticum sp.]|nr:hypothetical protein [Proteiniclasticum sp.]
MDDFLQVRNKIEKAAEDLGKHLPVQWQIFTGVQKHHVRADERLLGQLFDLYASKEKKIEFAERR